MQRDGVHRLVTFLTEGGANPAGHTRSARPVIGVLEGTGIGPQVIRAALDVLAAVEQVMGIRFDVRFGGPIGEEAEIRYGCSRPDSVAAFCQEVFDQGGAILSGPGGAVMCTICVVILTSSASLCLFGRGRSLRMPGGLRTITCGTWTCSSCATISVAFTKGNGKNVWSRGDGWSSIRSVTAKLRFDG